MKKIRLLLAVAFMSLAIGACSSSPLGVDCDPVIQDCTHNPGGG